MRKYCCNKTVYLMWLRRYWPGGALMALVYLFAAVDYNNSLTNTMNQLGYAQAPQTAQQLAAFISDPNTSAVLAVVAGASAGVAALLCYTYMQQPASAIMLHTLPIRREGLFFSCAAAGLTLLAGPIVLSGIMYSVVMLLHGVFSLYAVLLYLLVMLLCAALLFSMTTLMGMLTGHTVAAAVFTLVALIGPLVLEYVVLSYCMRYLFGFTGFRGGGMVLAKANPLYWLASWLDEIYRKLYAGESAPLWPALLFMAAVVVLMLGAVLLYRRRQVERAGDIVAVKPMRPVFRFGMALLGAVVLGAIFRNVSGAAASFGMELVFGMIGGALGYFVAEMFLVRSFKVLRRWKGAAVFCLVYALLMTGLYTDVFGYGRRQIDVNDVEYIVVGDVSGRVYTAMQGGSLSPYAVLQDLDIQGADDYLTKVALGVGGAMPEQVALQILQQDERVLKGDDAAAAVALQNMLAESSQGLMSLRQRYDQGGYYRPQGEVRYYSIPVMAKMKDGSLFYRSYTLMLPAGEYAEIVDAWAEVHKMEAVGQAENVLRMAQRANQVDIGYNVGVYTGERSVWTLNKGEWEGLFEAYLADVKARPPEAPAGYMSTYSQTAVMECYLLFGQGQSESIQLEASDENSMRWLVERGLLSEEEVAEAKERTEEIQQAQEEDGVYYPAGY